MRITELENNPVWSSRRHEGAEYTKIDQVGVRSGGNHGGLRDLESSIIRGRTWIKKERALLPSLTLFVHCL